LGKKLITVEELAGELSMTAGSLRNMISRSSGRLDLPPSFRVGKRRFFVAEEVETWIEQKILQARGKAAENKASTPPRGPGRPSKRASLALAQRGTKT
jgi:predicted DNA-binding transcriptional regulator AlpA